MLALRSIYEADPDRACRFVGDNQRKARYPAGSLLIQNSRRMKLCPKTGGAQQKPPHL